MAKTIPLLALFALAVAGCSSDGGMSKADEAMVKNNFTRSLTPDEVKHMGASAKSAKAPNDKL